MRSARLTPGKASLLMLGIGTASLVGLPGMEGYEPPRGALVGHVTGEDGEAVPDVPVALFDGPSLALMEITHTDPHGRFALQQAPEDFHVCIRPGAETGLLPGWALDLHRGPLFSMDFVLRKGVPVDVTVTDEEGEPIEDADVRAYEVGRGACSVVARSRTDASGRSSILAPRSAHVGVFGPTPERLPAWSYFLDLPEGGSELTYMLPRGRRLHGRVRSEQGQGAAGVVVSAWDRRDGWQWDGYRLTEEDGAYAIHAGAGTAEVRALDRKKTFLPARAVAGPTARLDLVLARGTPVEITCESSDGGALPARVWVWSEQTETWSWGSPTDGDGKITVPSSDAGFRAVARPLYHGSSDPLAWDEERGPGGLTLVRRED